MKKIITLAAFAMVTGSVSAATFVSGDQATGVTYNISTTVDAFIEFGGSTFVPVGGTNGAFDDLTGGYAQIGLGQTITITFRDAGTTDAVLFSGAIDSYDVDGNGSTAFDILNVTAGGNSFDAVVGDPLILSDNSGPGFLLSREAFSISGVDQVVIANTGNFGAIAVDFATLGTAVVPEPSSTALLGLAGVALLLRRRRV